MLEKIQTLDFKVKVLVYTEAQYKGGGKQKQKKQNKRKQYII